MIRSPEDDFDKYFSQYRPCQPSRSGASPAPSSYYSAHSRLASGPESVTETSNISSDNSYHTFNRGGSVYRSYPGPPYMPRSRSHGRDFTPGPSSRDIIVTGRPKTADTSTGSSDPHGHYTSYTTDIGDTRETDNISRDSGHSSAGTPEFAKRGFLRDQEYQVYRRQRRQADSVSLCDRGQLSDNVSVRSLDIRQRHGDRFIEDRRPAIIPRKSLMIQNNQTHSRSEGASLNGKGGFAEERKTVTQARHLQQRGYLVIALSVVICCSLLTCSSYLRQRCDNLNMVTWDLTSLKEDLRTKVVGQENSVRQIEEDIEKFTSARTEGSLPVSVLIILGSSGTGKTFLADTIEQYFPIQDNIHHLAHLQSINDLPGKVASSCGLSLVIIDDLEKEDRMMVARLEKMLITISQMEDAKSRGVLVIITSRTGENIINDAVLERTKENIALREKIKTDEIIEKLDKSDMTIQMKSTLEDYNLHVSLLPLLPLTRENVRDCTHKMFTAKNMVIKHFEVTDIVDKLSFFTRENPIYAKHGCKQVAAKVKTRIKL